MDKKYRKYTIEELLPKPLEIGDLPEDPTILSEEEFGGYIEDLAEDRIKEVLRRNSEMLKDNGAEYGDIDELKEGG